MDSHTDIKRSGTPSTGRRPLPTDAGRVASKDSLLVGGVRARSDFVGRHLPEVVRFPQRLSQAEYYAAAYPLMLLSRRMEERLLDLFKKGYVKGTVTDSWGNEATAVGMTMPLRAGRDVVSIWHRDLAGHLLLGATPYQLFCQYMANAESPTHAREGNCHHGDAARRRFPMMSHLGKMTSLVVGGTWAARRDGEDVFGLAVLGDGASSTGEIHESLNLASVQKVPVLFLVENNHYSFSTPTSFQYHCRHLADRAHGYGISGYTINGLDSWEVYTSVCDALETMQATSLPVILECMTLRLNGHAAYDKGDYVPAETKKRWLAQDPVPAARRKLIETCGMSEVDVADMEEAVEEEIRSALARAMPVGRPDPLGNRMSVFAEATPPKVKPYHSPAVKNGEAVGRALDYLLEHNPNAFLMGLDVGVYGSAFKTCKGLFERHGPRRVLDMPVCESAQVGFALGASQIDARPIMEFQFADFSTEVGTQLGMNSSTWYFRTGRPAPLLFRLPCGGGLTMGAFHSGEFEGLWSRFPGLKLLYPATAQETFEALVAGFHDPNPCLVFEHKQLYWSRSGEIDFDGNLSAVWRPRRYTEGTDLTVVAFGAMVHECLAVAARSPRSIEVWNPFVLQPMDIGPILESVVKTGRLLVVQECGEVQGLGDRVISLVCRESLGALKCPPRLVAAPNLPIPFAPELESNHRPNSQRIEAAVERMVREDS
ncbi:MAG: transketolase [Planctomycetes bacterium]|nr:transketolase [Planctomycetota bacterium]MBU4399983.1 transketolase [Planctomycetota bacterium]MCG2682941.1 thiamine pyrophosphate-dependent enzyme [Planctomycetales bacterium]